MVRDVPFLSHVPYSRDLSHVDVLEPNMSFLAQTKSLTLKPLNNKTIFLNDDAIDLKMKIKAQQMTFKQDITKI
jgi:hypothetical protein